MKINIIIPFIPFKPGGGLRVMFEYANHLVGLGHSVTLYYPMQVAFIKQPYLKTLIKFLLYKKKNVNALNWFPLDEKVKVKCIFNINDKAIEDGDIIFSTWWSLMFEIKKLSSQKGFVFNLIQDIENWEGNEDKVKLSYTIAKSNNLVIANYLYKYISQQIGKPPLQIPFAIDNQRYCVKNAIEQRDRNTICMMYSTEPRKGSNYGLTALEILKIKFPSLSLILFGIGDPPYEFPGWITYYKNHSNLPELYNAASIFLGPSNQEGCALPPMEAMYCGCAVVCTNIDGHKDYAFDGQTAIFANPQDAEDMAKKVGDLLIDNGLRIKIANQGHDFIKNYTWNTSTLKLESFFKEAVNNS